ncbi:MAG: ABC transporter substrate-binding protein [Lachnospiraceae bacterium]|nr:ABC transporter substrate-binding protein [Lachnospiraceae bacterium]
MNKGIKERMNTGRGRIMEHRRAATALILSLVMIMGAGCGSSKYTGPDTTAVNNAAKQKYTSEEGEKPKSGSENKVSDNAHDKVAASSDYAEGTEVSDNELTPVSADELNDGKYLIDLESSSSMFKVDDCLLMVENGEMNAILLINSDSYLYLYPGTAKEAAKDKEENYITFVENEDGAQLYTVPVEALDKALNFASYSKKKDQWYDRTLLFSSASLPNEAFKTARYKTVSSLGLEDGNYYIDARLEGGSGKAALETPSLLSVKDGEAAAMITWSSDKYDYMLVDGVRYDADVSSGASSFIIPVNGFDYRMPVVADTTAMSKPHEIEYTIYFDSITIEKAEIDANAADYNTMKSTGKMKLNYASEFNVDEYENDIYCINVEDDKYLLVPEKGSLPYNIPKDIKVIRTPVNKVYVASTSSMDFFSKLNALDKVAFVSSEASDWTDQAVSGKVKSGKIKYVGKYDAPDYETLITDKADLAVENTMIYHSPETKEKLEELAIPVFVDRTSYEKDPLGRVEWIKAYGLLTGKYDEAEKFFDKSCQEVTESVNNSTSTTGNKKTSSKKKSADPTVAFFYISPKGQVGIRKPGDYISKMIDMAGGQYIFSGEKVTDSDDNSASMDMSLEDFYLKAKDADILIYNSTLYGKPASLNALIKETSLLSDFKAVKDGKVYTTDDSMFQATCAAADIISELTGIVSGNDKTMSYFSKLK